MTNAFGGDFDDINDAIDQYFNDLASNINRNSPDGVSASTLLWSLMHEDDLDDPPAASLIGDPQPYEGPGGQPASHAPNDFADAAAWGPEPDDIGASASFPGVTNDWNAGDSSSPHHGATIAPALLGGQSSRAFSPDELSNIIAAMGDPSAVNFTTHYPSPESLVAPMSLTLSGGSFPAIGQDGLSGQRYGFQLQGGGNGNPGGDSATQLTQLGGILGLVPSLAGPAQKPHVTTAKPGTPSIVPPVQPSLPDNGQSGQADQDGPAGYAGRAIDEANASAPSDNYVLPAQDQGAGDPAAYSSPAAQPFIRLGQPNEMEAGESGGAYKTYGTPPNGVGQYGTAKAMQVITAASNALANGDQYTPLYIGNLSLEHGEAWPGGDHAGHRTGLEIDVRPASTDQSNGRLTWKSPNYDPAATQRIVDAFRATGQVKTIFFNDPNIKGVTPLRNHDDHLHVQLRR